MSHDIIDTYVYSQGLSFGDKVLTIIPFFSVALFYIGFLFIGSIFLKWLWNITIPRIFKLPEITYWEAFRLILIVGILFGGVKLG